MDTNPTKRLKIEKKENLATEQPPPLPVNIFILTNFFT